MLDMMLSSQPALKELVLDVESAIFRVPKSKWCRQHWYLMQPFLTLQSIQCKCPMLERYICEQSLYQSSAVDTKYVQTRFLENCRHLKFVNIWLGLDQAALQCYEHIKEPLLLEKGVFSLHKWSAWQEDGKINRQRMRTSLKSVAMVFNSRGTLKYVSEFLNSPPSIISLCLKCEFNVGYPFFDIDEGSQLGGFFEGLYCLASTVKKISLFGVPESEFDLVMGELGGLVRGGHRAGSWEHVRVTFSWLNDEFGQREQALIAEVFKNSSPQLRMLTIEAYCQHNGHGARLVFSKILSRRNFVASSSSPSSK